jgi:hypothetical protein
MSMQTLTQVYDEMRRLAIAGSVVAPGDFRLKKLIAPLAEAGAKAPVFARVADAVKKVVEGDDKSVAATLLDLATLVNAILYTQGETGAAGTLDTIETADLGGTAAQTSARLLKPLLEALSTAGSGRLELIRDAFERGAFRDLRLVKPALDAIDDGYGEIGDFIAEKVLPLYGKAILPELRAKLDLKGRGGHPRRLRLMHALDPEATRETVKLALDGGSKEVKVVAIECLGATADDLSYLTEQASAKAQDVRQAAYRALAAIDHDDAVALLQRAAAGNDLDLAVDALQRSRSAKLLAYLLQEAEQELAALPKNKDKKDVSKKVARVQGLLKCLAGREDSDSEALILSVFNQAEALGKIKGDSFSGADIQSTVVGLMQDGTTKLQTTLAGAHDRLSGAEFAACFQAARRAFPPEQVFEVFSPYLTPDGGEKKKKRDPGSAKREALCELLGGRFRYWWHGHDTEPPLDPRWLDCAVQIQHLGLVRHLARPGHAAAIAFLKETFDTLVKKAKSFDECYDVVAAMVRAAHPDATDAVIATLQKQTKGDYYAYWFARLIPELPKSAVPKLEAVIPTLGEKLADTLMDYIQQLREKA